MRAEKRTKKFLERFGTVERVQWPWSNPDLVWRPRGALVGYAVEVKSTLGITKKRVGRIWTTRQQWKEVRKFAKEKLLIPCMIVELLGGRTIGYWMISTESIMKRMKKSASFTVWQIVNEYGDRINADR